MDGGTLTSGACCGVTTVKNPILLAEHIRVSTPHTLIGFDAADQLATNAKLETKATEYFIDARRLRQLARAAEKGEIVRDHDIPPTDDPPVKTHPFTLYIFFPYEFCNLVFSPFTFFFFSRSIFAILFFLALLFFPV